MVEGEQQYQEDSSYFDELIFREVKYKGNSVQMSHEPRDIRIRSWPQNLIPCHQSPVSSLRGAGWSMCVNPEVFYKLNIMRFVTIGLRESTYIISTYSYCLYYVLCYAGHKPRIMRTNLRKVAMIVVINGRSSLVVMVLRDQGEGREARLFIFRFATSKVTHTNNEYKNTLLKYR